MKSLELGIKNLKSGYATNLNDIFSLITNEIKDLNWLITDWDTNIDIENLFCIDNNIIWISTEKLIDIVQKNNIQFIWGIFSGFLKNVSFEDAVVNKPYFTDDFTPESLFIRNKFLNTQILAVDSTYAVISSENKNLISTLKNEMQ